MFIASSALLSLLAILPTGLAAGRWGAKPHSGNSTSTSVASSSSSASAVASASGVPPVLLSVASPVSLESSFLYELDRTPVGSPTITSSTGVKVNGNVYIVDMEGSTKEQIAKYKADGKTVICYFSAGTWEGGRDDANQFDPACVCKGAKFAGTSCSTNDNRMADWDEWWLDLHSETCKANIHNVMAARIKSAKEKGCDGVDPDNVDSYINTDEQVHGNTEQDQVDYLLYLSQTAHDNQLLTSLKNAGDLLKGTHKSTIVNAFDFSVIEQCLKYKECDVYQPFIDAGKPMFMVEYGRLSTCPTLKKGQHLLVYSQDTLDTRKITLVC